MAKYSIDPRIGAKKLIAKKIDEYLLKAKLFKWVYYSTRLLIALASGLIPFVINSNQKLATALAITVVISVVVDTVFDPKNNWKSYSRASDLLGIAYLKKNGDYQEYEEQLEILVSTEYKVLDNLVDLDDIRRKMKEFGGR